MIGRRERILLGTAGVTFFFLAWLGLSWHSANLFFPPLHRLVDDALTYWTSPAGRADVWATLGNLFAGLALGIASGIAGGLAIGRVGVLDRALTPLVEFGRSIPQVALVPFAISLLGIGDPMKIAIIGLSAFWPVLLNVSEGIRALPPQWEETGLAFGLRPRQRLLLIVLPALLPRLLTGIHIALPLCLIIAVTTEMVGESVGIGATILDAQFTYDISRMWSGVLVLGLIGCLLNVVFILLERAVRRWTPAQDR